jgi:hypothetical protein
MDNGSLFFALLDVYCVDVRIMWVCYLWRKTDLRNRNVNININVYPQSKFVHLDAIKAYGGERMYSSTHS